MTPLSLYELNNLVRQTLQATMDRPYWIVAELSEVRPSPRGHCYVAFVQKDEHSGMLVAKATGTIWRQTYALLAPAFERATGSPLRAGMKVLVCVSVTFHELYGMSLNVTDIDASYSLGEVARRRREIIAQLEADGVLTLNKELPLPRPLRRIAVISSATAAGYGDFCRQLQQSGWGFHTALFPATMQGDEVEESIIAALDAIAAEADQWDAVAIIRGGGAVSDLHGFDAYLLAANVAQFPLPVLTGIGHERDETVIDLVACQRLKTPTAVAAWLISLRQDEAAALTALTQRLQAATRERLYNAQQRLQQRALALQRAAHTATASRHAKVQRMDAALTLTCRARLAHEAERTERTAEALAHAAQTLIAQHRTALAAASRCIAMAGPERILRMGFAIVRKDGHVLTDATQATGGDRLDITLDRGTLSATVE